MTTAASQGQSTPATSIGGALVATAGLLLVLQFAGPEPGAGLTPLAAVALALGASVLAGGPGGSGIVGASWVGRIALVVFGAAPLILLVWKAPVLWPFSR